MEVMKSQDKRGKKVFVGMSGGVDSSVSAALLKSEGYDVTGVFIKVWQPEWLQDKTVCTWREDRIDAMRVAAKLDISFITLDLEKEYKREVVDYMIREYSLGRTPNPDVMCNSFVKFGGFYDWAMRNGANFVATGHYAYIERVDLDFIFKKGIDQNKDQSYFLWTIKKEQLPHIIFPVGNIEKPEVRRLAEKFDLPTAHKKDSQGLCFIGKIDIKEFLSHYIPIKKGKVLNENGEEIGVHDGAFFYTIGERHGFTITKKTPHDKPYYVVSKNVENNTIVVSDKIGDISSDNTGDKVSYKKEDQVVKIENVNWINNTHVADKIYTARARYRQTLVRVKIKSIDNKEAIVTLEDKLDFIALGQSLVIYDGDVCMGGGIIS